MKGDPNNPADWEKISRLDLARARRNLADGDCIGACFWLQQSVEKVIKGWLIAHGWQLVKTHDLRRLADEVMVRGIDLSLHKPHLLRLSRLYFTDRYVDDSGDPEADAVEAAALLATADTVLNLLSAPLP